MMSLRVFALLLLAACSSGINSRGDASTDGAPSSDVDTSGCDGVVEVGVGEACDACARCAIGASCESGLCTASCIDDESCGSGECKATLDAMSNAEAICQPVSESCEGLENGEAGADCICNGDCGVDAPFCVGFPVDMARANVCSRPCSTEQLCPTGMICCRAGTYCVPTDAADALDCE